MKIEEEEDEARNEDKLALEGGRLEASDAKDDDPTVLLLLKLASSAITNNSSAVSNASRAIAPILPAR